MKNQNIFDTAKFSLGAQLLTGLISLQGVFLDVPEKHQILKDILTLESVVQLIEFFYYIWLLYSFHKLTYDITYTRYFDWFLSTPIMLVTTILFLEYNTKLDHSDSEKTEILSVSKILQTQMYPILWILMANFVMLLCGFLGERGILSRNMGFLTGTIAFCYSFYWMYKDFVGVNATNQYLFWFMFVVWSFYGIAYMFSYTWKNITYNILDVFSKNFYGLFLFWQIMQLSPTTPP